MVVLRKSSSEKVFDVFNGILMCVVLLITVYPFWNQVVTSLSDGYSAYSAGMLLWPEKVSLKAYEMVLGYSLLWTGLKNSIVRTILGTAISLVFTSLTAYPLSKSKLPMNGFFTALIFFTMLFGGGLVPNFLLIKGLGMLDTVWSLVLPGMIGAFNVFIMRNFFKSIPESLEESAMLDGAGYFRIFFTIVLPLSTPVLATVALWVAVGHWNAWFDGMIYISDKNKILLQTVLQKIIIENNSSDIREIMKRLQNAEKSNYTGRQLQAAIILVATIPMIIIYPFVQKYFVKGIMIGAIKG